MTLAETAILAAAFLVIAAVYSTVGHGGASGYLMVMGFAGLAPEVMKPTALLLNLFVATTGLARFARVGGFRWSTLWPFAVASVPCAFAGGAAQLDPALYRRLVAVVLLLAALRLAARIPAAEQPPRRAAPAAALLWGAAIGLLSGLVGVGGGIFLSPLLLLSGWATARQTAGVSAGFILVNSAAGLAGFVAGHGMPPIDAAPTALFAAAALAGGLAGTWLGTRRLGHAGLRRALAAVLVLASIKMLFVAPGGEAPPVPADAHVTAVGESGRLRRPWPTRTPDAASARRWNRTSSWPPAPSARWRPGRWRTPASRPVTSPAPRPPTAPATPTSA